MSIPYKLSKIDCGCNHDGTKRYPGTTKSECDTTNGVCECRDGYNGTKCDQCADGFFTTSQPGSASTICSKCGCNPEGTSNDECNTDNGYCTCKDGYEGIKCNQCSTGYFNSNTTAVFSVCNSKLTFNKLIEMWFFSRSVFAFQPVNVMSMVQISVITWMEIVTVL